MSDGDTKTESIKRQTTSFKPLQRFIADVSDVLSAVWVRRTIQADNGLERFVLDSRRRLLLNFRLFLVIVYITYTLFK
jgi:hypothetical protein